MPTTLRGVVLRGNHEEKQVSDLRKVWVLGWVDEDAPPRLIGDAFDWNGALVALHDWFERVAGEEVRAQYRDDDMPCSYGMAFRHDCLEHMERALGIKRLPAFDDDWTWLNNSKICNGYVISLTALQEKMKIAAT